MIHKNKLIKTNIKLEKVIIVGGVYVENSLAKFLKQEGVLQEFIEESRRLNEWEGKHDVVINSISYGFSWEGSSKGHEFWSELNAKYFQIMYFRK